MAGWNNWLGKKVFIIVRKSLHPYQGRVIEVDSSSPPLVFLTITDKYNKIVKFITAEIILIKEDE